MATAKKPAAKKPTARTRKPVAKPKPKPVPVVTDEKDTATSYADDASGLCRQCGKPADHLHQGV
jgi:hypothetical protein